MRPFPLGEDIDLLRESVRGFVDREIAPRADLIDREISLETRQIQDGAENVAE